MYIVNYIYCCDFNLKKEELREKKIYILYTEALKNVK